MEAVLLLLLFFILVLATVFIEMPQVVMSIKLCTHIYNLRWYEIVHIHTITKECGGRKNLCMQALYVTKPPMNIIY